MAEGRREFLTLAGVGTGLLLCGCGNKPGAAAGADQTKAKTDAAAKEDAEAGEDLMREHGVLRRVFTIYEDVIRRIETDNEFPPQALAETVTLVRSFIENYHNRLEEDLMFPALRKAGKHVDLIDILLTQHAAGRKLNDTILKLADPLTNDASERLKLSIALRDYMRMYRPHTAREDTVLVPALHEVLSGKEYDAMSQAFEAKETELLGPKGFEKTVEKVADLERAMGVYDLSIFTVGL